MITSKRDYIERMFDEVGRLIARLVFKRGQGGTDDAALETVIVGMQRLFHLEAEQIFSRTPAEHYGMLIADEPADFARDKLLMYAALCAEAGYAYARLRKPDPARASFLTALRFTLRARGQFGSDGLPGYTPDPDALLALLADSPLDPETAALVAARRK